MNSSENKKTVENEIDEEGSYKNAMYSSILFVGGGLGFFWILLFIIFSVRG